MDGTWGSATDPGRKTGSEIVGVVKDFDYLDVRQRAGTAGLLPVFQEDHAPGFTVYVRTRQDLTTAFAQARRKVATLDVNVPVSDMWTSIARWSSPSAARG